jgi:hypothetical protein
LWDGFLVPGPRTILQDTGAVYVLALDDITPAQLLSGVSTRVGRWTEIAHMLIRPLAPPNQRTLLLVGGAQPFSSISGGTVTLTQGSTAVTGSGTAFGSAPPGAILKATNERPAVIASVQSGTGLTLAEPWPHGNATNTYTISAALSFASPDTAVFPTNYPAYVTQMFGRLILGNGNRVSFTHFNELADGTVLPTPFDFTSVDFHLLPEGVVITGLEALRDTLLVFTTAGAWAITGLAFDIVDAFGNPQQRLEPFSRDLVLWGDAGIAQWRGGLVVPAIDDLYLIEPGGAPVAVTGGGRRLYRDHVKNGLQPGQASVFRGHYTLPVLDAGNNVVDELVWRLDSPGVPLTRWGGHGGSARAFAVRSGSTTRQPDLLGAVGRRVESYRSVFDPEGAVKDDADGTTHALQVTTRTFTVGTRKRQWALLRARTEQDDVGTDFPTWTGEVATGRPGNDFAVVADPRIRDAK